MKTTSNRIYYHNIAHLPTMDRRLVKYNPTCHKSTEFVDTTTLPGPS
jgi:hypothetical protein